VQERPPPLCGVDADPEGLLLHNRAHSAIVVHFDRHRVVSELVRGADFRANYRAGRAPAIYGIPG